MFRAGEGSGLISEKCLRAHDFGNPGLVGRIVTGDAPFAAGAQDAGHEPNLFGVNKPALGVSRFRPRVREQQEDLFQRRFW